MFIDDATLDNWFSYHAPSESDNAKYGLIRAAGRHLAETIVLNTPASPDQTAAVRKVREAVMTANAAIACGGV